MALCCRILFREPKVEQVDAPAIGQDPAPLANRGRVAARTLGLAVNRLRRKLSPCLPPCAKSKAMASTNLPPKERLQYFRKMAADAERTAAKAKRNTKFAEDHRKMA